MEQFNAVKPEWVEEAKRLFAECDQRKRADRRAAFFPAFGRVVLCHTQSEWFNNYGYVSVPTGG